MKQKFEIIFLEEAIEFMDSLEDKARTKIFYNLEKAKFGNDPKLFKKLTDDVWEFRTLYNKIQYRLFAFWDKTGDSETLVVTTHGIIKKVSKVPKSEIEKTNQIKTEYFNQ
ncbi:type II toxin-antitoxin system RelE/ParE family toxin [Wenyingzhuangia sp. chi5]|uniref:Type II toxin-antitoxin system RelE/ParE family toxin n=1 Tax=Wenyingzhuangia gilva TaxID=3057677 RepID=A0ABT8VVC6_9FLAO|nr:type II toxin-antitoxin system RelE/ParE family toxin [Wenyingzhuangia sp. chi5]MDO3695922.1 type II toxin-antitoxin system RelE/ParE family toxin [Wenyingzhuangia sp. chi5]